MLNQTRFSLKFNGMSLFFSTNIANINLLTPLLLGQTYKFMGCGFEPHWCHCVVVLEQDTFILA